MTGTRAAVVGTALAGLHLLVNVSFAALAAVVWSQGLPQDYDTAATMTLEARVIARSWLAALPLLAALVVSIVLLLRGRSASPLLLVVAASMLVVSNLLGAFVLRTLGGFGW